MQEILVPPLAVSGGDPAGIGLELTIEAWRNRARWRLAPFALYADVRAVGERIAAMGANVPVAVLADVTEATTTFDRALPVIDVPVAATVVPGRPDVRNAPATIAAIEIATAAVLDGAASALVTNPIAKNVLYGAGFSHPGHTEFLAALAAAARPSEPHVPVMMLACDELRVVPLTIHVPLARVPALITASLIVDTCRITHQGLRRDFGIATPRIAIAGLNPHAGESGTIGREDLDVIAPAIRQLAAEGMAVSGPHSADTLFHPEARSRYDAVVAMYHDQALIPIKTIAFDRGVNITLGLPFVRTSPDHGTAFDIAGKFVARPTSFVEALRLADAAARRRRTQEHAP